MNLCVDTVVLIDILKDENRETQEKLYRAIKEKETLMTTAINVAELLPQFGGKRKVLSAFLQDHGIQIFDLDLESALIGAHRWIKYLKRRKARKCSSCGTRITGRDSMLADFMIGGFALTHCDQILTRDRGIYRTYFADLRTFS